MKGILFDFSPEMPEGPSVASVDDITLQDVQPLATDPLMSPKLVSLPNNTKQVRA